MPEYIQSAKTELERLQKQGNTAAKKRAAEQRADHGNKSRDTPFSGKEKGNTVLPMPPHRKVKGIVRAVPFPAEYIKTIDTLNKTLDSETFIKF